ncbi:MAG: M20/M25/M40 family metallo-hydrolase [Blastocatellia bacterium]|nr:M20/M25/M40 family metallo-hydrolase [Blastocatellia bacterium]
MVRRIFLLVLILALVASEAALAQTDSRGGPDFKKAGDEAVALLADYIRIDTTNPPGNESLAARFFAGILEKEGIEYKVFQSAPGRGTIYARLKGSGRKRPLIMLNHLDVVEADKRFWSAAPFGGEIRGGYLYGRGALDMKSLGAAQFMVMLMLKRAGVALDRDVIFLGTADEEAGGREGAGWLVRNHPESIRDAEFLINEGSSNSVSGGRVNYYGIGLTEKTPCWLRLTIKSAAGHGSIPRSESAPSRMLRALGKLEAYETRLIVTPAVARYFKSIAPLHGNSEWRRAYSDIAAALNDPRLRSLVLASASNAALLRNTIQPTVVHIGNKTNVIAPLAVAEIDCRLLPGQKPEDFIAEIKKVINDPGIEIETILAFSATESPVDTDLYQAITSVIKGEDPSARFVPTVLAGFTDSHFFREMGITSYGFSPFLIPAEDFSGVHGNDERIPVESLREGTKLLYRIVHRLCAAQSAPAAQ